MIYFDKILVSSIICGKYSNNAWKIFKEEELNKILKIRGLIKSI